MKITHKVRVEKDFIDDIICNRCGKTCIPLKECGPEGLSEVNVRGGYGSEILGDGDFFTFSMCERCLAEIILDFKIPPEYGDTLSMKEDTYAQWCARAKENLKKKDVREPWKS